MEKIEIIGSSFSQVNFSNAFIKNCSISSCTFEGAIFKNANLENLNLSSLNIEYADFYDTNFKNVYLPIMQLPYTFGGLINFFNKEGILIKTNQINHPSKNLSTLEYKKLLPSLEIYFLKMNEFFPLANIYLARKEFDKFDDAIQHGIKLGFLNKDFRIIKHLCKLVVKSSIYSVHQLKSIYVLINELGKSNSNDKKVFHEYSLHLGEIQTILFSSIDEDSVEISFRLEDKTKSNEIDMFNAVLKEIEAGINCVIGNSNWYYLQIQKNSPLEVILKYLPDSFETAILIIFACGYLLKQSTNFIKDILEIKEKKKKLTEKEKEKIENELNNRRNNILNINVNINNIYISNSQNIFLNSDNIDYLN